MIIVFIYIFSVPPKEAIIQDAMGRKVEGVIGPYFIGQHIELSCESLGGKVNDCMLHYFLTNLFIKGIMQTYNTLTYIIIYMM